MVFFHKIGFFCSTALSFLGVLWLLCPLSALSLSESDSSHRYALLENRDFYQLGEFQGTGGVTLFRAQFGRTVGERGALVFVNGWAENLLKYIELFYDLHLLGFSPIYTYDHRGQGFSDRLMLEQAHISHIEDYSYYEQDLHIFINQVLQYPEIKKDRLFLLAHSMGGNIVLNYLQKRRSPFQAVALSAPMLGLEALPSFLEFLSLNLIRGICFFNCEWALPGVNPQKSEKQKLTSSVERIAFAKHIAKTIPQVPLTGLSANWVLKSVSAGVRIMDKKRIQNIKTPLLILQAEQEVLVSNKAQDQLCREIPHFCVLKTIKGRHELFLEKDNIRNQAISAVAQFFSKRF